jgi:hypothetical protein
MDKQSFLKSINENPIKVNKKDFVDFYKEEIDYARTRGLSWKDISKIIEVNFGVVIEWNMLSNYVCALKKGRTKTNKNFGLTAQELTQKGNLNTKTQERTVPSNSNFKQIKTNKDFVREPEIL